MFKFSNISNYNFHVCHCEIKEKKRERETELNKLQRLKRREKRDWIDGTDNLVYIFYKLLLVSSGEEANTCSTLGAFQATPLKPTHELLHFALLPSLNALNACFYSASKIWLF